MRVAFLTHQFPSENDKTGGVGSYVLKMATALKEAGHEPEVFVISRRGSGALEYKGIRVERVPFRATLRDRALLKPVYMLSRRFRPLVRDAICAWRLARALEHRHQQAPFDIVQSSNFGLTGWFVRKRPERRHLVRISTSRILYDETSGEVSLVERLTERCDVRILQRADAVYAPSRYLASYFRQQYGVPVHVLRPPHSLAVAPSEEPPQPLPPKFLVHFGNLCVRKGTDLVAEALLLAWKAQPDIHMVWVGRQGEPLLARYQERWGEKGRQVRWLGALPRERLYSVVKRADAAVLPSRVDNLPNTVIESLMLGVPVIGSNGASIDELVEPGHSGELVPIGDVRALAEAMVRAWRGEAAWSAEGFRPSKALEAMAPAEAVARFLDLASSSATLGERQGHERLATLDEPVGA